MLSKHQSRCPTFWSMTMVLTYFIDKKKENIKSRHWQGWCHRGNERVPGLRNLLLMSCIALHFKMNHGSCWWWCTSICAVQGLFYEYVKQIMFKFPTLHQHIYQLYSFNRRTHVCNIIFMLESWHILNDPVDSNTHRVHITIVAGHSPCNWKICEG